MAKDQNSDQNKNPGPAPDASPETAAARKANLRRELLEWVRALVIALIIAIFLTQVVIVNAQVPSESMENTIQGGDRVIGYRLAYLFKDPAREDIVIFHYPDNEEELYIKRIIGMPGDVVEIKDGKVYINNASAPLEAPYVKEAAYGSYGPYTVPENSYFVMGDNRNHSWDSRFWQNTFVARDKLVGKAGFRIFPNPAVLH